MIINKEKIKKIFKIWHIILILLILIIFYFFKLNSNYPWNKELQYKPDFFGVTFSTKFCHELGLDWQKVYSAILDDLQVKNVRLPIYWDEIEKEEGKYDFSEYDYIIQEGNKRNVKFILNIGWRLPRWPECHAPEWASNKSLAKTQASAINMIQAVVEHYKDESSILSWQLENEPFLDTFGVCPMSDENFFRLELDKIKQLDNRQIVVSATGELSFWRKEAKYADIFGTTIYRVVWGPSFGYIRYPIPAWTYRLKARLAGIKQENRVIVELQAEPWVPSGNIIYLSPNEIRKSFSLDQFKANAQFAINVDFEKAYLWGVEWWYYQYLNNHKEYWEFAKTLFN